MKKQSFIQAGDVELSIYEWGKSSVKSESIILIHGYPDDASVWDSVAGQLAKKYHVVSYDVRGTGRSSAPLSSKGYRFEYLLADLDAVIQHVSPDRKIHLVGHDWGALQGWEAVFDLKLQDRIQSYTALAPGLDHVGQWFHQKLFSFDPRQQLQAVKQLLSSAYMAVFNIPVLPETGWHLVLKKKWPSVVESLEKVKVEGSEHVLRNGINGLELYRKNLITKLLSPKSRKTPVAVHLLSMKDDQFVPQHLLTGLEGAVDNQFTRTDIQAGHWGILSQPERIADAVGAYVQQFRQTAVI